MDTVRAGSIWMSVTHKFSIDNTNILSKNTTAGNSWTLVEVYTQDNEASALQMERSMTALQYDLHLDMATHIGQVKIMGKKFLFQLTAFHE